MDEPSPRAHEKYPHRFGGGEEMEEGQGDHPRVVFKDSEDKHLDGIDGSGEKLETRCGIGRFHPAFMQIFARVECFTAFYSLSALITSTLQVYVNSQLTTLERQFGFSSSQTGIIMAANDIGYLLCVLLISYGATYLHVPRSLGIATLIFAVSGLVCSLPFFVFRPHIDAFVDSFSFPRPGNATGMGGPAAGGRRGRGFFGGLCVTNSTGDACAKLDASSNELVLSMPATVVTASLGMIVVGMMLQGCAKSPRNSFVLTYIDDNTGATNSGLYMGIVTAVAVLGPVMAFVIGGLVSRVFVTLKDTQLTMRHPRWIGAWWLGYVVCGVIALVVAIPLMFFPRKLPKRNTTRRYDVESKSPKGPNARRPLMANLNGSKPNKDEEEILDPGKGLKYVLHHSRSFMRSVLGLLTNPVYMAVVLGLCGEIFGFIGGGTYYPKYTEQVFDKPIFTANYIMAGRALIGGFVGILIGGFLSSRFKMTPLVSLKFAAVLTIIHTSVEVLTLFFSCEQPTVHNWPGEHTDCNDACGCQDNTYFAVCGSDQKTYYSPCAAGCGAIKDGVYRNCTCIPGLGQARIGACPYGCNYLYPFTIVLCVKALMISMCVVPKIIVMIRSVPPKDKGVAVGGSSFLQALIGYLAGPVVFGQIVDTVCDVWDVNQCDGSVGRCLVYDNNQFRIRLFAPTLACSVFGAIMLLLALVYAMRTGCLDHINAKGERMVREGEEHGLGFKSEVSGRDGDGDRVNGFTNEKDGSNSATNL